MRLQSQLANRQIKLISLLIICEITFPLVTSVGAKIASKWMDYKKMVTKCSADTVFKCTYFLNACYF